MKISNIASEGRYGMLYYNTVYKLQYDNTILLEGMSTRYISDCCDLNLEYSGVQVYVVTRRVVDTVL